MKIAFLASLVSFSVIANITYIENAQEYAVTDTTATLEILRNPDFATQIIQQSTGTNSIGTAQFAPLTITESGAYALGVDLIVDTGVQTVITIAADNVILDLNQKRMSTTNVRTAITLSNARNVVIMNGIITGFRNRGILVNNSGSSSATRNILFKNILFYNNGGGLEVTGGRDIYVEDCYALENVGAGFFLSRTINGRLTNCQSMFNPVNFNSRTGVANGFDCRQTVGIEFYKCTANNNTNSGFSLIGCNDSTFIECTANANRIHGFLLSNEDGNSQSRTARNSNNNFLHCVAQDNLQGSGFSLAGRQTTIDGCVADRNNDNGFTVTGNNHSILNNIAKRNGRNGINLSNASPRATDCQVRGNTVTSNGTNGIIDSGLRNRVYSNFGNNNGNANFANIPNVSLSPTATTMINFTANISE